MTEAHSTRAHARLAPSGASIWIACPGSVALSEGLREPPSPFANEGTAAHMLAERCLAGGSEADWWRGWMIDTAAKPGMDPWFRPDYPGMKPDGLYVFEVDAEMVDAVQLYLDVVREIAEQSEEFDVEQRLDNSDLVPGCFGTGDTVAYRPGTLTIADLKYGKGVAVEVFGNKQLLTYALGLLRHYHNREVNEVELVIVQPRAPHRDGPVRRWSTDVVGLYEYAIALQDSAEAIADPNAPRIPGSHCKFCKAAAICPELREHVYRIIGANRNIMGILEVADAAKYSPEQLAQAWRDREIVAGWCRSVEKFAHAEAMAGQVPPGLKLVRKDKHRAWKDESYAAEYLEMAHGIDLYEKKPRSPAAVEKEIPAKERKVAMAFLAEKPVSNETALAELDDERPAYNPGEASGFEAVDIEVRE